MKKQTCPECGAPGVPCGSPYIDLWRCSKNTLHERWWGLTTGDDRRTVERTRKGDLR